MVSRAFSRLISLKISNFLGLQTLAIEALSRLRSLNHKHCPVVDLTQLYLTQLSLILPSLLSPRHHWSLSLSLSCDCGFFFFLVCLQLANIGGLRWLWANFGCCVYDGRWVDFGLWLQWSMISFGWWWWWWWWIVVGWVVGGGRFCIYIYIYIRGFFKSF